MRIAIVTGASSGIGQEFVKQISMHFSSLEEIWVIARRKERMEELQDMVDTKLRILPLDLTNEDDLNTLKNTIEVEKPNIRILVNSSGFGKIGMFSELSHEENIGMIDLNCKALTSVTYFSLPYMKKGSRIIQIASSAGFLPQPRFAVYAATKSYVLSLSRALAHELKKRNISVLAVCPGPVKTEFFDLAEKTGKIKLYKKVVMADPVKVVKLSLKDSKDKKEISVYSAPMKLLLLASKLLPQKILLSTMDILK